MILKNAAVFRPDHRFHNGDLAIREGRLCADTLPQPGEEILDAQGLRALPGPVDLHFHGAVGRDVFPPAKEVRRGASHMTHLYNAMPGISHREPGPILAALEENAEVELIADGVHLHPAVVRFTFRVFGDDRVILISDSMMACGLPDGEYTLGGPGRQRKPGKEPRYRRRLRLS